MWKLRTLPLLGAALLCMPCISSVAADPPPTPAQALAERVARLEAQVKTQQEQIKALQEQIKKLESAAPKPVEVTIAPTEIDKRIKLKMEDPIPASFENNKLINVIDYVHNTTGVDLYVDWPRIEAAGIKQDTPITFQVTNKPADTILKLVLHHASGTERKSKEPLVYAIVDGMVVVTTKAGLAELVEEKVRIRKNDSSESGTPKAK